jgi:peptide/nickel transport system substrate-binding protein
MKAMNTALTVQFYGENAERIFRPISNEMWKGAFRASSLPKELKFTTSHAEIEELVEEAGWSKNSDGIYEKNGKKLELKFTIAGESKNHPAYGMFDSAAKFLNECGFVITVGTDIQALSKLATGGLQVWAAAWSTGVDPDPYQTYHKDSTATSVKNWNYSEILDENKTEFWRERETVNKISELIDRGRKTLDQSTRITIYTETLNEIMNLAVELPTYQRKDLVSWNREVLDEGTMNINNATSTTGVLYKLWKVSYK